MKRHNIALTITLIGFLILTTLYSLTAPAFEGPDEQFHYKYSKDISEGKIPEAGFLFHAPLYYSIIAAFLTFVEHPDEVEIEVNPNFRQDKNRFVHSLEENFPFQGTSSAVHSLRFFSIFCGLITLIFIYKISQLIFPSRNWLPNFVVVIVAFTPKFAWINSVLNNDVLVFLFSTIAIFFLVKFVHSKSTKHLFLLGIFTGLAILSKSNGMIIFPIVILTMIYLTYSKQIQKKFLSKNIIFYTIFTLISGGWYTILKFILKYNPENLHLKGLWFSFTSGSGESISELEFSHFIDVITNWQYIQFRVIDMIWSNLGWHVIDADGTLMGIAQIILIVSLIGLFLVFVRKNTISNITIEKNHAFILFSLSSIMLAAMLFYMTLGERVSGDIRYTFPVIAAYGILFSVGYYALIDKGKLRYLLFLPIFILISLNISLLNSMDKIFNS